MRDLRLFTAFIFFLFLSSPLYAFDNPQDKNADKLVVQERSETETKKAESDVKTELIKTESVYEVKTDSKSAASEPASAQLKTDTVLTTKPAIMQYQSNPLAVKAVERSVSLFTDRIKEKFSLWLSRSGKYLDLMKDILKSKDLPEDMAFLSLIESGFNPNAYSVARAVGPWQFISSTAKKYGLVIDWWRDERRDPVKSTEAAADYLKDLYGMFGSWNLAMVAYNAGEGKILRVLNRTKADDFWSLLKTHQIKRETKDYVPHFIAASMIAVNPEEFGFKDIEYYEPFAFDEVTLNSPIDLDVAAKCAGTTIEVIRELNPELRRWCTPPDASFYILRIPAGTKELFLKNLADIPDNERFTVENYIVKKGDTINAIAKKTGVTVKAILVLNSMDRIRPLKLGTRISLPPKEKFELDRDDRYEIRKVSFKKSSKGKHAKHRHKKVVITAMNAKTRKILND